MRIAWKVRVAGCLPGSRVGTAAETIAASCPVRSIGSTARAATIARAMRFANRSSPRVRRTVAMSRSLARASHCAAPCPASLSMRMSSGPSCMKLKPRLASSSCGEETPRSISTPSSPPSNPAARTSSSSLPNDPCTSVRRGSPVNRTRPARIASGSRSMAMTRPRGPSAPRIAAVCPPRPNVASQYRPSARTASPASTSSGSTGVWSVTAAPRARAARAQETGRPSPRPPAATTRGARSSAARPRVRNGCPGLSALPGA